MTKYVTMQRPRRRLSFWQRTLMVFLTALVVMGIVFAFLYSRSFSLVESDLAAAENATVTAQSVSAANAESAAVANTAPSVAALDGSTVVTDRGAWLFRDATAVEQSTPSGTAVTVSQPADPTARAVGSALASPTVEPAAVPAINERPELLRDLRLSEQSLAEDEPRVAMELLLGLSRDYPTFRPAEVAQRLYEAYLALGDQAMRREARSEAVGYYDQAARVAVADQTGLQRRRAAIARLFSNLQGAPATQLQSQEPPNVAVGAEPVAPTATPTPAVVVPPAQSIPAPTPPPVPPVALPVAPVCPDAHIALTAPSVNAEVKGSVAVVGTVRLEEGWYYKVEWAPAGSGEFAYLDGKERAIDNNVLARLDTTALPNGAYVLRVTVVDQTGNYPPPCEVPIVVVN